MTASEKSITFGQYTVPKLKAGEYTIHATLATACGAPTAPAQTAQYEANRTFAVAGLRFRLGGDDLASVFPPNLSAGPFEGVLPHAVLNRSALPWSRSAGAGSSESTTWLAVLTIVDGELPVPDGQKTLVTTLTVADLISNGQAIGVAGAAPTAAKGTMPNGYISYPNLQQLDYGESPSDPVDVIDLPVAYFSRIAPTAADLVYLAHTRQTDTCDSVDNADAGIACSIVLGNRMAALGTGATALLVSLENMDTLLPDDTGNPSDALAANQTIRLAVLTSWHFLPNQGDAALAGLLAGLNQGGGASASSSLRMPGAAATADAVALATSDEAASGLSAADAGALVANALAAGYVPLDHHLREAGKTVSWMRGPLLPQDTVAQYIVVPASGADALLRYDPNTGMFDVSYAAAWQLGQLLGLRSRSFSVALHRWRAQSARANAAQQTTSLMRSKLSGQADAANDTLPIFAKLLERRQANAAPLAPVPPATVIGFLAGLSLLEGVPFNYLVPDEGMLPMESLRLFALDPNWICALIDGAFGIGRTSAAQLARDAQQLAAMGPLLAAAARASRSNDRPALARLKAEAPPAWPPKMTGILMRSEAVRNWPGLQISAYSTTSGSVEPDVPLLRMQRLSKDVLLCLFDGTPAMVSVHEPPEQLHCGVEMTSAGASTTLRQVGGANPGQQYGNGATAAMSLRQDGLTMQAALSTRAIEAALSPLQGAPSGPLQANQFALQLVKGAARANFIVAGALT